ncbi:hypothetical protein THAOC_16167 [Thalassiosira oceanica]|uniref:Uncharacterized protein n=1 Tax=Thalassiosira oceanica TaxID=159749 RepID=K0SQD1_THAOC|nr:hypothetical protein THAOC_16167 [Thalassiosira oceanica]|eukprot:EJK63196.1 hypothetical protein THAOC_16167 [Thalassiosira oceanica]
MSSDRRAQRMAGIDSADYFTPEYILDLLPWCTSGQYWPLSAPPVSCDTTARQGRHGSASSRRRPQQRRTVTSRRGGRTLAVGGRRDGGSGWCNVSPPPLRELSPGTANKTRDAEEDNAVAKRSKRAEAPSSRGPKKAKRHRKDGQRAKAKDELDSALDALQEVSSADSAVRLLYCFRPPGPVS